MEWLDFWKELTGADFFAAGGIFLLLTLLFLRKSKPVIRKLPAQDDMRGYELIYADQKQEGRGRESFGKLLYSAAYELQGKPDYVFRKRFGRRLVPMELKSGKIGEEELPHRGDFLQLGAYFLLLEDVYGRRPAFGRLVYQDYMFEIKNTRKVRNEVSATMREMREMLKHGTGQPNSSFAHCRPCICNGTVCPFSGADGEKGKKE